MVSAVTFRGEVEIIGGTGGVVVVGVVVGAILIILGDGVVVMVGVFRGFVLGDVGVSVVAVCHVPQVAGDARRRCVDACPLNR